MHECTFLETDFEGYFSRQIFNAQNKNFVFACKLIVKNYQQITFAKLNTFCPLSNTPPALLFFREYQVGRTTSKLKEPFIPILQCISSFEPTFNKKLQDIAHKIFYFLLFDSSFYISRYYFS